MAELFAPNASYDMIIKHTNNMSGGFNTMILTEKLSNYILVIFSLVTIVNATKRNLYIE